MQRSHAFAVVSFRALALLAVSCLALAATPTSRAYDFGFGKADEAPTESTPLEDWQLEESATQTEEMLPGGDDTGVEEFPDGPMLMEEYAGGAYQSRWLPEGLIYHSYLAGVYEPRLGLNAFYEASDSRTLWDATLGGRVGIFQYGNGDPFSPEGYQIDVYGAAIARLDTENRQDLDSTDYVFGMPLTWGDEHIQYKVGYAHISSHLGDEYALSHPGSLAQRINYVRDSIEFGTSYYVVPACRLYGELDWAFHRSGGARPLAFEFGTEVSRAGPTGHSFTPFMAVNARMRQEHDFGGDVALQAGWLRRNILGQTLRFGGHYYNGKSSQAQFFTNSEEQVGMGVWYDF